MKTPDPMPYASSGETAGDDPEARLSPGSITGDDPEARLSPGSITGDDPEARLSPGSITGDDPEVKQWQEKIRRFTEHRPRIAARLLRRWLKEGEDRAKAQTRR